MANVMGVYYAFLKKLWSRKITLAFQTCTLQDVVWNRTDIAIYLNNSFQTNHKKEWTEKKIYACIGSSSYRSLYLGFRSNTLQGA